MNRRHVSKFVMGLVALGCVGIAVPTNAQVTPFQIVGHIDHFCLDNQFDVTGACPKDAEPRAAILPSSPTNVFIGAKMVVNGLTITIPRNTVVLMPAAYFTPWQIFDKAQGVSRGNNESGLALHDKTRPLAAFEVAIDGNIVCVPTPPLGCTTTYVAGQVHISQQSLNVGAGFIRQINVTPTLGDPQNGFMCIGANPAPLLAAAPCLPPDSRIHLNDPKITEPSGDPALNDGRYGVPNIEAGPPTSTDSNSRFPDPRFMVDQGNPTVHALTGYPMCVPRSGNDLECPDKNRPGTLTFVMHSEDLTPPVRFGNDVIKACPLCDDSKQAPVKVGDYVTFAGTVASDGGGRYVSVHTLVANVGIYTAPGGRAYVSLDESLLGTRGPLSVCASAAECQDRLKIEGFTTDPSRRVSVYAVDVLESDGKTPGPGTPRVRLLHSTEKVQAVFGRFRYVPPLTSAALFDFNGDLKGATRELMVRIDDPSPLLDGSEVPDGPKAAHGLVPGIYIAPVGEYIFPEPTGVQGGVPGDPLKPNLPELNFHCLSFLVNGWAIPPGLPTIKRLDPWPGAPSPTFSCTN